VISRANVKNLAAKWVFTTGGVVSATPTVSGNSVYFPDWAGNLYAVRADTGTLLWSHPISDNNHQTSAMSRVSPAI
jgi:polyvinyl alcohol dehydrogenase (cytochrome)